jgi:hypothetical protein
MKNTIALSIAVIVFTFSATTCIKSNHKIYIAGGYKKNNQYYACYWENDKKVNLHAPDNSPSIATDIKVYNEKIYIAGAIEQSNEFHPCYWVDGMLNILSGEYGMVNKIIVANDIIYAAGYCTQNGIRKACYWKGDELVLLPTNYSYSMSIFLKDDDVYIGGYFQDTDFRPNPCYWLNGEKIDLSGDFGLVTCINEQNGMLILAGICRKYERYESIPNVCYWINGVIHIIDVYNEEMDYAQVFNTANAVNMYNGDIYFAGIYGYRAKEEGNAYPCYFMNNNMIKLPIRKHGFSTSIFVCDNSIYIAGGNFLGEDNLTSCYWVNNIRHNLPGGQSITTCIFVTE